jgi:SAM-dependent methyltransferase
MAHSQQLNYIQTVKNACISENSGLRIIEIGSYDVNGSIRKIFGDSMQYIGVDLTKGPGVDLICSGEKVDYDDNYFDVALSCECFEHNPNWVATFENMVRMVKPGGIIIITCASTGREEHGTIRTDPSISPGTFAVGIDYYKNLTKRDFLNNFNINKMFSSHEFLYNFRSKDLYFIGYKKSVNSKAGLLSAVNQTYVKNSNRAAMQRGWLYWSVVKACNWSIKIVEAIVPNWIFEKYIKLLDRTIKLIATRS